MDVVSQNKVIAYQGEAGAKSHSACRMVYPEWRPLACATFEEALAAISDGAADLGMIPIENSIAGRVADAWLLKADVVRRRVEARLGEEAKRGEARRG